MKKGFTLVELMISITIFAGVIGAGYAMYAAQQKSYMRQQATAELQQNTRAVLYFLERDIRMAGFDPTEKASAGVTIARPAQFAYTADIGGPRASAADEDKSSDSISNGMIDTPSAALNISERTRFALQGDADFDGIPDAGGTAVLGKEFNGAGGLQPVIENVERLEFFYHLSDGRSLTTVNAADLPMIRSVTVSLLLRANKAVQRNSNVYYYPASNAARASTGKKWGPFSDNFMRQMAVTEIKLRNMGLIENI